MTPPYQRVHVVINPASGQNQPILNILNDVFHSAGVDWDVTITHKAGDAARQAKESAASGVDLVAAYGGDGTQMEVANGLLGTGVPQAILPGGTGNAMAHELNVPLDLREAAGLIVSSANRRAIDLVRSGDKAWMLRAYTGVSAADAASRDKKDKYGQLAYIQASLKIVTQMSSVPYVATVDGEVINTEALICFILNAGSIGGVMGMSLPTVGDVDISDGYLDLYAITKEVEPLRSLSKIALQIENAPAGIYHWRGKEIKLEADPAQDVWVDGELGGQTPFTASVLPLALEFVVPE
ncbi:MAG TPA: diacylglycerol kinase family protein [Anaerolineales bacterium]|nr:diacylglycerol kinase family protein [Anaerolineales bacterium]